MRTIRLYAMLLGLCCLLFQTVASAWAGDIHLKIQLIWGTDEPKPKDPKHKLREVDKLVREKISKVGKVFSWKNYFEVKQADVVLPPQGSQNVEMSSKCRLEIRHLNASHLEVKLFGEGRLVQTVRHNLPKGEFLFLAGDTKDGANDAWIVALSVTKE